MGPHDLPILNSFKKRRMEIPIIMEATFMMLMAAILAESVNLKEQIQE